MGKIKPMTDRQRKIAIVTLVALFIYAIVNAFLVIFAYTKLAQNIDELADLAVNWRRGTILNLKVETTCPSGYEELLDDRYWPGVDHGCWCGSVSPITLSNKNITCSPFCSQNCSSEALGVGCKQVPGRDSQLLDRWGSVDSSAKRICVERTDETWGNSGTLPNADGDCPDGYFKCGTNPESVFCTLKSKCPISQVAISSIDCTANPDCFQIEDGAEPRYLSFRRSDAYDALPLVEFRVNEHGMCKVRSKDNITPNRKQFPLISKKLSTCDNDGDEKWSTIETLKENALFDFNNLQTYVGTTLNEFTSTGMNNGYYETGKTGADYDWSLFARSYIPWKMECRDRLESVLDQSDNVKKLKTAQSALLAIGLISTLALGIVLTFIEIQNLRGVDIKCIKGEGDEERARILRIKKILNYTFKFIVIPFQIWAIIITSDTRKLFTSVSSDECSDDAHGPVLDYFAKTLNSTFTSNILAIVMTCASLLVDLLLALLSCCKGGGKNAAVADTPKPNKNETLPLNNNNKANDSLNVSSSGNPFAQNNSNFQSPTPQGQPGQTITIQLNQMPSNQPSNQPPFGQPQMQTQYQAQPQYGQPQPQYGQPQPQYGQPQPQYGQPQPQYGQPQMQYPNNY